jgi:hypothetical protein
VSIDIGTETGEQEKDSRYIQGSWVPYALPAVCLDIRSAEAQLGKVHATCYEQQFRVIYYVWM